MCVSETGVSERGWEEREGESLLCYSSSTCMFLFPGTCTEIQTSIMILAQNIV